MTNQRKKAAGNLMESAEHARVLARYSATSVLFWDRLAPRTRHWDDISAADHGASDPLLNSATATVPIAEATAPDLVARLDDFFAEAPGGGWVLWSAWPAPILEQHGFTDFGQPPLMIRADHDDPVPVPAGLRIEEATTPAEMAIFDRSIAEWYPVDGYLEDARDPFFSARSLGTTHRYWIGFERDQAVSVAMAVVGPDLVGIFAVATAPSVRGKGYGGVLTDIAARCMPGLPAVLTSSSAGFSVYERIGFRKIGVFHLWLRDRQRR